MATSVLLFVGECRRFKAAPKINRAEPQLTPNCSPTCDPFPSWDLAHRHKPLYTVNCAESVGTTFKFVLIQLFIDRSSDQY